METTQKDFFRVVISGLLVHAWLVPLFLNHDKTELVVG